METLEQILVNNIPTATCYFSEMEAFGFSLEPIDINTSKGKRAFDKLRLQILKQQIQKPKPTDFIESPLEDSIQNAIHFLENFLGPMSAEGLKTLPIIKSTTLSMFDAATEFAYDLEQMTITPKKIKIYKKDISYNTLALIHENTHILFNRQIQPGFHYHYNELLPILMELIATTELNDPTLLENYIKIRLQTLQHHFLEFDQGNTLQKQLKTQFQDIQLVIDYTINNSYSYIISTFLACHLFEQYKEDPETMKPLIKACINHQQTLEELLKQRHVTLKNHETIKATQKVLKLN